MSHTAKSTPFLVYSWIDLLVAGGGFSLILFPILFFFTGSGRSPEFIQLAATLSYVVNYPHFAATIYRLYHNKNNRDQYRFAAYAGPWVFVALFLIAFSFPSSFGGWYCKLFLIWSGYHYSGQTLGISLIYARRTQFPINTPIRWLLTGTIYTTYLFPIIRSETQATLLPFYGIQIPSFHLPAITFQIISFALAAFWAGFLSWIILAPRYMQGRRPPMEVLLPIFAQFTWFIVGSYSLNYYELVPLFHGLQYLLIVWFFQMREQKQTYEEKGADFQNRYAFENIKYWGIIIVLGAMLFQWIPHAIHFTTRIPLNIAMPIWIATVQIHHFWVDGLVWRLRQPFVGRNLLSPQNAQKNNV